MNGGELAEYLVGDYNAAWLVALQLVCLPVPREHLPAVMLDPVAP